MSWMARLYETYEAGMHLDLPDEQQLMPISHTYQNAHIRATIDGSGNFLRAEVLEKTQIILPATEQSSGRTSGEAPHPLADKIQYVAKDYTDYGGKKKSFFQSYFDQLNDWAESDLANNKIRAVRDYVAKGNLIQDLIDQQVLHIDESGVLLIRWPENSGAPPALFKVLPKQKGILDQGNALVCWSVEIPGVPLSATWKDPVIQDLWVQYEQSKPAISSLCYVTGEDTPIAENHPAKLRHSGDKAKLISSNDTTGFTFKGRFVSGDQSAAIGSRVSQKAHNALRWLIARQGYRNGDQVIISWAVSGNIIPSPMIDSFGFLGNEIEEVEGSTASTVDKKGTARSSDSGQYFSIALSKRLAGYQAKLPPTDSIIIMGLDSATPGRMAITYYQELLPQEFIDCLGRWYRDFAWFQRRSIQYQDGKGKVKTRVEWHPGTATPKAICEAIYGSSLSDSLKKNTIERLLPCIIEGRQLPRDLMEKAFHKAAKRQSYRSDEQWLWEKNLAIACSLFKGFSKRNLTSMREYTMALEEENNSRDYLFGRLLAIAERLEGVALSVADENRSTTAARLMQRFADRPSSTWRNIELALQPYIQRLKSNRAGFLFKQQHLLDEVMGKFHSGDYSNDKPLSAEFLLAFHSQRLEFKKKQESNADAATDE